MSDFVISWRLSRGRFLDAVTPLDTRQLNWRLHPGVLTAGEMALHVAGVEISFAGQLTGQPTEGLASRLRAAATDGVVNDKPFPFEESEITPELVAESMELAREWVQPILEGPTPELLETQIVSALGPVITGEGALARLAFHAGYHQGQVHLIATAPEFPS